MIRYVAFTLILSFLSATTINIPADYATVQEGIDAAQDGDIVLVSQGTYYENLTINKEITLTSTADFAALEGSIDWYNDESIRQTIINGSVINNPNKRSCVVVRDGNIQPTIKGFTFESGVGTKMLIMDCGELGGIQRSEITGGGVLIYDAYPIINYNRFVGNGISPDSERGRRGSKNGGAIAHYEDAEVEFDEDRDDAPVANNSNVERTVPGTIDVQNNYFEDNTSGNGQGFYSLGYTGSIDVSNSVFDNIDCETNTVNEYVLNSSEDLADYVQDGITGACIEENAFYVATNGDNANNGTESAPFQTISHALTFVKEVGAPTTIYVAAGTYSPDLTKEIFPIVVPNNAHIIGEDRETTILDADADASEEAAVVIIKEVEDVIFKNFTLVNGYTEGHGCIGGGGLLVTHENMFDISIPPVTSTPIIENLIIENSWSHNGGGISFYLVDGPVVNDIVIRDNQSTMHGGGIFIYVSNVVMSDVVVTGNRNWGNPSFFNVGNGGGIMSVGSGVDITNLTLTDNIGVTMGGGLFHMGNSMNNDSGFPGFTINGGTISGNQGSYGGGLSLYDGADPILNNVEISSNQASSAGGGVHMDGAFPFINNCVIKQNSAGGGGGVAVSLNSLPRIENTTISENEAAEGAAMQFNGALGGLLRNCLIINNHGSFYSGGISIAGTDLSIINTTISGNSSDGVEGSVDVWAGGKATIVNSILWDNQPVSLSFSIGGGEIDMYYSNTDNEGWEGNQNLNVDPLFVDVENSDFGLQIGSACIDAGTTELSTYFPEAFELFPEIIGDITEYFGTAPDMGAYEMVLAVNPPTNVGYMLQTSSIILMWSAGPASYQYKVEKSLVEDFSADVEEFLVEENSFTDTDIVLGVEYFYRITSVYGDIYSDPSDVLSLMIVPIPTGLEFVVQNDESVALTWDNDENATGYQIQRSRDPMFFGPSDIFNSTENTFTDNTLPAGIMHYYRVRSIYGDYLSDASDNVSVIIVPAPVGVVYNTIDEFSVSLSWDEIDISTGYMIERSSDSLFASDGVIFNVTENSFIDENIDVGILIYYRVSTYYGEHMSVPSANVSVLIVPAPVGVVYSVDESSVSLSWDAVNIAGVSYVIERATDSLFTADVEEFTSTENSFVDNSVEAEIEYYYRVSAVCCDGDYLSSYSDVVSVMLTIMDVDLVANIPDAYSLQQNYPNPFNPTTQIRYGLKENTYVSINIYNLMGKNVKSLMNRNQDAGYQTIHWNATDASGQPVPAGMYIYSITAGDFRQTRKMILLK